MRFQNGSCKVAIELRVVQFWSEIILVISNRTCTPRSFNFEITRMISDQTALHSVQLPLLQGSYPFSETNFQDFSRTQIDFFRTLKFTLTPFTPKFSMLILLTVCHTFHIFSLEFNRFPALFRTSSLFPILSKFFRSRTNPVLIPSFCCCYKGHFMKCSKGIVNNCCSC